MIGMPNHWNSFMNGAYTGTAAAGIAEVSQAMSEEGTRLAAAALGHLPELAHALTGMVAGLV